MARSEVFRFRITPEERERFDREAEAKELSKADLIREALGWDRHAAPAVEPGEATRALVAAAPTQPQADPEREPGKAAIEALAARIRNVEGKTTAHARREARQRLKGTA